MLMEMILSRENLLAAFKRVDQNKGSHGVDGMSVKDLRRHLYETDRPQFKKLLAELQEGDTLVVTKLDRLARNTKEGIEIIESLFEKGVKVHVLNVGLLENTTIGRFFLQTLLAVAEMERNLIVERTQEGKALARQREDFREGRPRKHTKQQVQHALKLLETHTYKEVEAMTGITKRTLIRRKNELEAKKF
jgi:DNA invertase Pin-like site-specific DNA recombinase